jgi:chromosomal replication initiator protein
VGRGLSNLEDAFKGALKERLPEAVYRVWFSEVGVNVRDRKLILEVANEFAKNWIKENYQELISAVAQDFGFHEWDFQVVPRGKPEQMVIPYSPLEVIGRKLSPRYTFEDFVVGKCNELAYKVSLRFVEEPPKGGLVYFCGTFGLGKTHLSQAIANALYQKGFHRVFYFTAQDFLTYLMKYLKSGSLDVFKTKVQEGCDLLIIDGVHFLSGKEFTQVELAFLLDYLLDYGKNVIFTSLKLPKDMVDFDSTLKSRLNAGLILRLNQPDFETRKKIIRFKAKKLGYNFPYDVVEYLARMVRGDIRQIESVVNGLIARAKLLNEPITVLLAKELLSEVSEAKEEAQDLEVFVERVCKFFGIERSSLFSNSRKKELMLARQVLIYLLKKHTQRSLKELAEIFKKEHSTIIYHLKSIEKKLSEDRALKFKVELLAREILEEFSESGFDSAPNEKDLECESYA